MIGSDRLLSERNRVVVTNVYVTWKPLLWYVKGDRPNIVTSFEDFIQSKTPDKIIHDWDQSSVEAEYVIQRVTVQNQIVLDSFMGGAATTGSATIRLNRKFIGIEKDKSLFKIAKNRIGNIAKLANADNQLLK